MIQGSLFVTLKQLHQPEELLELCTYGLYALAFFIIT